ncbi:MAG: transcription termination factor Rho [Bifidobacteriaceae bacterium]|jgi:transcription termination factor Rho|nr:transcription termination factor Rho [Bifidobacteriaceae bacterium]
MSNSEKIIPDIAADEPSATQVAPVKKRGRPKKSSVNDVETKESNNIESAKGAVNSYVLPAIPELLNDDVEKNEIPASKSVNRNTGSEPKVIEDLGPKSNGQTNAATHDGQPASSEANNHASSGNNHFNGGGSRLRRSRAGKNNGTRSRLLKEENELTDTLDPRTGKESNQGQNQSNYQLVEIKGLLDIHDTFAFVRVGGYLSTPSDAYVSISLVRKLHLRKGDVIQGLVKISNEPNPKQKFNPLHQILSVNGLPPEQAAERPNFDKLTPLYPDQRLRLETSESKKITERLIDLISPIGKGQRGLIVAPPKAGKTMILQKVANAITDNNPDVKLMVVLVDERPEEVTDMERTVKGEVISSTFDRQPQDHTAVAELAIERAKRLVETGADVVVLLDSITRLSRAYNLAMPQSGRVLSGGVDSGALYPPKKFFGAARNIENGGSLTIIATALVETGSKMDEVIFEEFKGTGNLEIRLSRELADKRIFPAIDINASGTRKEELLMDPQELEIVYRLRRLLAGLDVEQATDMMLKQLKKTGSNAEFLLQVAKTTPEG